MRREPPAEEDAEALRRIGGAEYTLLRSRSPTHDYASIGVMRRVPGTHTRRELADIFGRARSLYRMCASIDPDDSTGQVNLVHELYRRIFRLVATGSSRLPPPNGHPHLVAKVSGFLEWVPGVRGFLPKPPYEVPLRDEEIAAYRFSCFETVDEHLIAERRAIIDLLADAIRRRPDETYAEHRARISRRMELWKEGVSEAVTMTAPLTPAATDAPLPPGPPRSPERSGRRTERRNQRQAARSPESTGTAPPLPYGRAAASARPGRRRKPT